MRNDLQKGKELPIGTERERGGNIFVKTADGWKYKSRGKTGTSKEDPSKKEPSKTALSQKKEDSQAKVAWLKTFRTQPFLNSELAEMLNKEFGTSFTTNNLPEEVTDPDFRSQLRYSELKELVKLTQEENEQEENEKTFSADIQAVFKNNPVQKEIADRILSNPEVAKTLLSALEVLGKTGFSLDVSTGIRKKTSEEGTVEIDINAIVGMNASDSTLDKVFSKFSQIEGMNAFGRSKIKDTTITLGTVGSVSGRDGYFLSSQNLKEIANVALGGKKTTVAMSKEEEREFYGAALGNDGLAALYEAKESAETLIHNFSISVTREKDPAKKKLLQQKLDKFEQIQKLLQEDSELGQF